MEKTLVSLEALHTHTHTHTNSLNNKKQINKNKDSFKTHIGICGL